MPKTTYEFQWGERCSMLLAECFVNNFGPYLFGRPKHIDYAIVSEDRYNETFASKKMLVEWNKLAQIMLKPKPRAALMAGSKRSRQAIEKFFKEFSQLNISAQSDRQLFALTKKLAVHIGGIIRHFTISDGPSSNAVLSHLRRLLKTEGLLADLPLLITQTVPDILTREQQDLAILGEKKNIADQELHQHSIKYAILFYNSYDLKANLAYLRGRLQEKFDLAGSILETKHRQNEQAKIFNQIKNPQARELCLFFQALGVERLELKNCWAGAEFRFLPLFKEIARRVYLPLPALMATFTMEDYRQALVSHKNFTMDNANGRLAKFVLWKKDKQVRLLEKLKPMRPFLELKKTLARPADNSVTGTSANGGIARGVIRVVRSLDIQNVLIDLARFNPGDILLTWMTQPNMVPIARFAGAIIADEGGITSHAAVIAREFNVPCIVGAKIATKFFKEGDLVEVDGDKGVVRLIKRAE